jgi:hypothetical protein
MHDKILLGIIESAIYKAAQGVTYWLGYKSSFFENHHVNEGAIVSEFASIYGSQRWILQDDLGCGVFGATQIVSKATAARPPIKLN